MNSPRQIGVNTFWEGVLAIGKATAIVDSKKTVKSDPINYIFTTRDATVKWMVPLDSTCKIGPETISTDILTVDEGVRGC